MITGFNTDVEYDGRVFHVQTEDRGRDNPVVESLVYSGGEIVTQRKTSYADLLHGGSFTEAELMKRMDAQHRGLLQEIAAGKLDPDGPKPFGYNIITNRSFDAVVREFLSNEAGLESLHLALDGQPTLVEGSRQVLRLRVTADGSAVPLAGATVVVKLLTTSDKPRQLLHGVTGDDGTVDAEIEIPETPRASATSAPSRSTASTGSMRFDSMKRWQEIVRVPTPKRERILDVRLVSSHAISATLRSRSSARGERSSRFPRGVATTHSVPGTPYGTSSTWKNVWATSSTRRTNADGSGTP